MTRTSIHEYAAAQRERYARASRREKQHLLDHVTAVIGYHRKAAIRLLRRAPRGPAAPRSGRPRLYTAETAAAAAVLWEAAGEIGAVRLQPFIPELLRRLAAGGECRLAPATVAALCRASAGTLKRLLAPVRQTRPPRGRGITRAGTWLKHQIPIRTFADWSEAAPGFLEGDLVAHCGDSTEGFSLCTLCAVDIVTGWIELVPVWGKGQPRVGGAIDGIRRRLPMPLRGGACDPGSECINAALWDYCHRHAITFTRGRAHKKNDSAHVEQKNGAVVRRWIGYDRSATRAAHAALGEVHRLLNLHVNFFQPVQKLVEKVRTGPRVRRVYDAAQTPYQRLCATGVLKPEQRAALETHYQTLKPLALRHQLDAALKRLWGLTTPRSRAHDAGREDAP